MAIWWNVRSCNLRGSESTSKTAHTSVSDRPLQPARQPPVGDPTLILTLLSWRRCLKRHQSSKALEGGGMLTAGLTSVLPSRNLVLYRVWYVNDVLPCVGCYWQIRMQNKYSMIACSAVVTSEIFSVVLKSWGVQFWIAYVRGGPWIQDLDGSRGIL